MYHQDLINNNRTRGRLLDVTNRAQIDTPICEKSAKRSYEDIVPLRAAWNPDMDLGGKDGFLFPPGVLSELSAVQKWSDHLTKEGLILRPLKTGDSRKGFLELLSQLTLVGTVSHEDFESKLTKMALADREWIVVVVKMSESGTEEESVIGTATLTLEEKFIHSASSRARIEDVCVHEDHRSLKLGRILLESLVELAKTLGSYKLSLECKHHLVGFYEKMGFTNDVENNFMILRFKD